MISCKDIVQKIDAYLDQELLGEERKAFEEHLNQCETCRILLEKSQKLLKGVKTLSQVHASTGFAQTVQKRLKGEEKVKNIFLSRRLMIPIQLAALLIVGFFIFHEMLPRHPVPKGPVIIKEFVGTGASSEKEEDFDLLEKKELSPVSVVENTSIAPQKSLSLPRERSSENQVSLAQEMETSKDQMKRSESLASQEDLEAKPASSFPGGLVETQKSESSVVSPITPLQSRAFPEKEKTISFDSINDSQKEIQKWIWIVLDEDLAVNGLTQFLEEKGGSLIKQENDLRIILKNRDEITALIKWLEYQGSLQPFDENQISTLDSKRTFIIHAEIKEIPFNDS